MAAIIGKTTLEVKLLMQVSDGEPVGIGTLTIPLEAATITGPELPIVGRGERLAVKQLRATVDVDPAELRRAAASGLRSAADALEG